MFWSAQAVKGDVNFVGLLAPSLQISAGYYKGGPMNFYDGDSTARSSSHSRIYHSTVARSDHKGLIK